jgi:Uma2 family endonuclease
MVKQAPRSILTVEEYLKGELTSEVRHEYANGQVYAMVGASSAHNIISLNLAAELRQYLRGGKCQVFISDMKVRISTVQDERFYYPDVLVSCDPTDQATYYRERPLLIVEVLSTSTERQDRSDKLYAYRRLQSLQEYVLIAQDVQRIEVYRRSTDWDLQVFTQDDDVQLESIAFTIPVSIIYDTAPLGQE